MFQMFRSARITWLRVIFSFFAVFFLKLFFLQLGWNHRFNRLVAKYYPNVWHFIECLKKEEVCVRQHMLKITMGGKKQINKKVAAVQDQIHSLQSQFKEKEINICGLLQGLFC